MTVSGGAAAGPKDPADDPHHDYDFAISFVEEDQAWARWLVAVLGRAGYTMWLVEPLAGNHRVAVLDIALRQAERTISIVSRAADRSPLFAAMWRATVAADLDGSDRKLIPVRVDAGGAVGALAEIVCVDLFGLDEAAAGARLLSAVEAAVRGPTVRSAPRSIEPVPFPGRSGPAGRAGHPSRAAAPADTAAAGAAAVVPGPRDGGDQPKRAAVTRLWTTLAPRPNELGATEPGAAGRRAVELRVVAVSPDSRWWASAGDDGSAWVWAAGSAGTAADGQPHRALPHPAPVRAIVFDPSGSLLATACADQAVRLWRPATGELLWTAARVGEPHGMTFTDDGRQLLAWADGVWNRDVAVASEPTVWRPGGVGEAGLVGAVSAAGLVVAATGGAGPAGGRATDVEVFHWPSGRELARLPHPVEVSAARFDPRSRWVATVDRVGTLRLWDPLTGRRSWVSRRPSRGFALDPVGVLVAVRDHTDVVDVVDVGPATAGLRGGDTFLYPHAPGSPTFSPGGRWLCLHSPAHRTVHLHDLGEPVPSTFRLDHDGWVNAVAFSPDGGRLRAATAAGRVVEWGLPGQDVRPTA